MNYAGYTASGSIADFMYKVYGWMAAGLTLTGVTAYYLFYNQALFATIFGTPFAAMGLMLVQIALVVSLVGMVNRMSMSTATMIFLGYSILTGVTLSSIFYVYTMQSIYLVFGISAGMFATMALYGYVTKDDLTGVGSIARMGLFGIIIAMIVNIFLKSAQMDYVLSLVGVAVFTLLTAYDNQKIKQMGHVLIGQGEIANKASLQAALMLYLDFINLFLFLLRIMGQRRRD
ncbi:MAG: Bax inhibitor-1 family protein [Candidatus Babeliales bacterium]